MMKEKENVLRHQLLLCLVAVPIGVMVGIVDTIFGKVLLYFSELRVAYFLQLVPFLFLGGVIYILLLQKFGKESSQGMKLVFLAGHGEKETIPLRLIPFVMGGTWMTHLLGGSAGREGVAVQLGATIANNVGRKIPFLKDDRASIIIGIAAGFAGLFQTPMAATFFAMEILMVGKFEYRLVMPALLAALTASTVSGKLLLEKFSVVLAVPHTLDWVMLLKLLVLGVILAMAGGLFSQGLKHFKKICQQKIPNPIWRIGIGGIILSILLILFYQGRYAGLGTNLIQESFSGGKIYLYDWILKMLLTIITIGIGFPGGEVTPLFAIGATLGVVLAPFLNMPVLLVAALGYIGIFASATNTLLAPIIMGGEVFGFEYIPYFLIVSTVAYSLSRGRSIYAEQKYFQEVE